jgi:hypothetical protein
VTTVAVKSDKTAKIAATVGGITEKARLIIKL